MSVERKASLPPPSITHFAIPWAVAFGMAAGSAIVFGAFRSLDAPYAALVVILSLAMPCILVEMFLNNGMRNGGLRLHSPDFSAYRVIRKLVALWAILGVLWLAYNTFQIYELPTYKPFLRILSEWFVPFLLLSIPYVAFIDSYQEEPRDLLFSLGEQLLNVSRPLTQDEVNYLLGWVVKGFFLPLMFCYLCQNIEALRKLQVPDFQQIAFSESARFAYTLIYRGAYFLDICVSTVGYIMTFRLFGTQIRSVQPTVKGWVVTLICYQPFWTVMRQSYLNYSDGYQWGRWLSDHPVVYTLWGLLIVFFLLVYASTRLHFGIRFSNLTHRGIITSGPYRWTKHPSYVAKLSIFFLIDVPFVVGSGSSLSAWQSSVALALTAGVYYLRAKTEEQHLGSDPVYVEYMEYIERHGAVARLLRLASAIRQTSAPPGTREGRE